VLQHSVPPALAEAQRDRTRLAEQLRIARSQLRTAKNTYFDLRYNVWRLAQAGIQGAAWPMDALEKHRARRGGLGRRQRLGAQEPGTTRAAPVDALRPPPIAAEGRPATRAGPADPAEPQHQGNVMRRGPWHDG
jgi:hypothetical protein